MSGITVTFERWRRAAARARAVREWQRRISNATEINEIYHLAGVIRAEIERWREEAERWEKER